MTGRAEFPYQMLFIYLTECNNLQYDLVQAIPCQDAVLSHDMAAGAAVWLWHAPSIMTGVPESNYVFTICGIVDAEPVATEAATWGRIKHRFAGAR